ncbi:hypothetical protein BN2537_14165 [Streptomyces venezuelae]|nr:hypothetical protein BN2537_14165 [Streptomyces venezuelae]
MQHANDPPPLPGFRVVMGGTRHLRRCATLLETPPEGRVSG